MQLCFDNGDLERMCSFIIALTKKRGQAKRAIVEMVNYSMELATKLPHLSKQKTLLNTLRTVTEGKLFLEVYIYIYIYIYRWNTHAVQDSIAICC